MQVEQVYIHKCYENELGYRSGIPKKAGRFIFITKETAIFFPHLSKLELNDNVLVNIVDVNNNIIASNYVYHNSKTATTNPKERRDEYRLYITKEIDTDRILFKPNDIIAFTKYKIDDEMFYKLNLFSFRERSTEYEQLNLLLQDAKKGVRPVNHLLIKLDNVGFLKETIDVSGNEKIFPTETIDNITKNQEQFFENLDEIAKEDKPVPSDETGLIKSNNFRDLILFAYMGKCAITGKSITYSSLSNLEAAHIMPQSHNGPDAIPNGLALSRDLHWAFDKGFFTIIQESSEIYIVNVHEYVKENEVMKEIDGKKVFTPNDPRFRLHINAIDYHKQHIFGTFKQIRSNKQT